jgi:putative spermidine/putrescine transport system ATP-binding protein
MPALQARGLVRSYEGRTVVDIEDLTVEEGLVVAVLGPNGAGKSTLFRLLSLLEEPDAGTIMHFGEVVRPHDTGARRAVASVFQHPFLFQGKVRNNVAYGLRVRRLPRSETRRRVEEALELTAVAHLADADVRTLSGGEAQRVALARALVLEPSILFLDEPTSNLDIDVRRRFRRDLKEIVDTIGTTVVLITHDRSEAFSLARRIMVMRDGRIVQQGDVDEVYSKPKDTFVANFMGARNIWRGSVDSCSNGLCSVRVKGGWAVEVVAEAGVGEETVLAVRPEDIALSDVARHAQAATSVRNHWVGTVESVLTSGPVADVWVVLDEDRGGCGPLHALVTRPSVEQLALAPGVRVEASVKATAVHLLDESEER